MKLNELNSKTVEKIQNYVSNKQNYISNLNQRIEEKNAKINELNAKLEALDDEYMIEFNDGILQEIKKTKQEISQTEEELKDIKRMRTKSSKSGMTLIDEERAEVAAAFAKVNKKRDKAYQDFLKKKAEVVRAFEELKAEQLSVDPLFTDLDILVSSQLGINEWGVMKNQLNHVTMGDINEQVRDMYQQCSKFIF